MMQKKKDAPGITFTRISRTVGLGFWAILLVLCFLYRKEFTVAGILQYTPANPIGAAMVLIACFGIKSLTVFLYSGIFYTHEALIDRVYAVDLIEAVLALVL